MENKIKHKRTYDEERFRLIFEYSPIAIWEEDFSALAKLKVHLGANRVTDIRSYLKANPDLVQQTFRSFKILDVNRAALRLYGVKTKKELIDNLGKTVHRDVFAVLVEEFAVLLDGQAAFEAEFKSRTRLGDVYDVAMKVSVPEAYKDSFSRVIVTIQDVSVQKRLERRLRRLAQTDGLTGLFNHNAILHALEHEFLRARRYGLKLSCLMVDLDFFKKINDRFGHQTGDAVLKRTADLIKKNLREVDILGRYGGDEFLIILPETSEGGAKIAATRLKNIFASDHSVVGQGKSVITVSIGVSVCAMEGMMDFRDLLSKADDAMYSAKKAGRNCVAVL